MKIKKNDKFFMFLKPINTNKFVYLLRIFHFETYFQISNYTHLFLQLTMKINENSTGLNGHIRDLEICFEMKNPK